MEYITKIALQNVRNIPQLEIFLDEKKKRHLFLTGTNGSGKTTVIKAIYECLEDHDVNNIVAITLNNKAAFHQLQLHDEFIICMFDAYRKATFIEPNGPMKIEYSKSVKESVGKYFVQLMVNLRTRRSFAREDGDNSTVEKIQTWFDNFEKAMSVLLGHTDFELQFDTVRFNFRIKEKGKEPYNFSQLSDGYSALLTIVTEIMLRMSIDEPLNSYDKQGVVLIDEVENHLHIELQKKIMPFLITLFPNIQFIATTNSPFVLSSIKDSVIFDISKDAPNDYCMSPIK